MPSDRQTAGDQQEIPVEVRALDVVLKDSLVPSGEGPVHRYDSEAQCSHAPSRSKAASTDLETAAVNDEVYLCDRCEWPDRATEVVSS